MQKFLFHAIMFIPKQLVLKRFLGKEFSPKILIQIA
jgi:hypothetical protein